MPEFALYLAVLLGWVAGCMAGWVARGYRAERDQYRAEEERDARWDAEHLTRAGQTGDARRG